MVEKFRFNAGDAVVWHNLLAKYECTIGMITYNPADGTYTYPAETGLGFHNSGEKMGTFTAAADELELRFQLPLIPTGADSVYCWLDNIYLEEVVVYEGGGSVNGGGYRYSFNGKEDDNEIEGQQDYGFRIYDKRLGRFKSVDPITRKYPELTPYQFASNSPILFIDLDGLEKALPWYLRENKYGGKPVLTLGLGNLPTGNRIDNYEDLAIPFEQKGGAFVYNSLISAWDSIATTWNDALDGKTGSQKFNESINALKQLEPKDFKRVETWENLAGGVITFYVAKRLFSFDYSPVVTRTIRGTWVTENTKGWSARAIKYQEQITGVKAGNALQLELDGVKAKFDGYRGNTLLEAKKVHMIILLIKKQENSMTGLRIVRREEGHY